MADPRIKQHLMEARSRAVEISKTRSMAPGPRIAGYAECARNVGQVLSGMGPDADPDGSIWQFSKELLRYILVQMNWVIEGQRMVQHSVPAETRSPPTAVAEYETQDDAEWEARRMDKEIEKEWRNFV